MWAVVRSDALPERKGSRGDWVAAGTTADSVWRRARPRLEAELGSRYRPFFGEVIARRLEDDVLTLGAPNPFVRDWLAERLTGLLEVIVGEAVGRPMRVELEVIENGPGPGDCAQDEVTPRAGHRGSGLGLNPRYSFDTFVMGAGNRLAHAAALRVAEAPGRSFNPLVVHGETGLGKTHLLQATARYAAELFPGLRVRYVTSEGFLNAFVAAVVDRRAMTEFRRRYRDVDVLLLDDAQFFARKERVQEELLHTLSALHDGGSQIFISTDRPPGELRTINAGLRSRFEMGLVAKVERPDQQTRLAILHKLAEAQQLSISDPELLPLIARRVVSNVRELQGALVRVAAFSSLVGRPLTSDLASELLPTMRETEVSIERVEEVVSARFGLPVEELRGRGRSTDVVYPRHVAMHLARKLTGASLPSIGRHFGRDHTTVIYADRRLREQIRKDRQARDLVEELTERVRQPR